MNKNSSNVAVIILNWNGSHDTIECVGSVMTSIFKNFTIFVIDNGSEISDYNFLINSLKEVEIIRLNYNYGFAGGNNVGIITSIAMGFEFVWILNNDTTVEVSALGFLVEFMNTHPNYAVVSPNVFDYTNPALELGVGGSIMPINLKLALINKKTSVSSPWICDHVMGVGPLVRSQAIKQIGLMEEGFFMYREETEWMLRFLHKNWLIAVVPASKLYHKVASSSGQGSPFQEFYMVRNTLHIVKRYYKMFYLYYLIFLLPYRLIANFVKRRNNFLKLSASIFSAYRCHLTDKWGR